LDVTRRNLIASLAAGTVAAAVPPARLPIRKAVYYGMLPNTLSVLERFQLARECGFEEIECPTTPDPARAAEMMAASKSAGLRIHSVMNQEHWRNPLNSSDPAVVERSMEGMRASLRNARDWGADTVLLVPAVLGPDSSSTQAWERSQRQIRLLLPMAEEYKVIIGIEDVGNKFLLSPLEMARYVDEFRSPWVRAYFDTGNILQYGYPQDWIRTLGKRIVKLHLKDNATRMDPTIHKRVTDGVNLLDGDTDWRAVHAALAETGYNGTATVELAGGDAAYLKEVVRRFDRILEGV
jgi:hexulose-6-phosphate isomerase